LSCRRRRRRRRHSFLGRVGPEEQRLAYGLLIGGTWGTTVALFIHTLKFKGYIGARTGAIAYEASFPWMIYFFFRLALQMSANADLACVCVVAVGLNFATTRKRPIWHVYQVVLCALMAVQVYGPEQVGWEVVSSSLGGLACSVSSGLRLGALKPGAEALVQLLGDTAGNATSFAFNPSSSSSSFLSTGVFSNGASEL
jgi:hypothetical protein